MTETTDRTELDRARASVEAQLDGLRDTLRQRAGLRPRRKGWWVLLLAGAVGLALGSRARRSAADRSDRSGGMPSGTS